MNNSEHLQVEFCGLPRFKPELRYQVQEVEADAGEFAEEEMVGLELHGFSRFF